MLVPSLCLLASVVSVQAFDGSAPFIIAQGQKASMGPLGQLNPATSFEAAIDAIPCGAVTLIFDQPK
ncbi:hypothetical protein HDU98_001919, partial [Podochytrium sp. JEL0797]